MDKLFCKSGLNFPNKVDHPMYNRFLDGLSQSNTPQTIKMKHVEKNRKNTEDFYLSKDYDAFFTSYK